MTETQSNKTIFANVLIIFCLFVQMFVAGIFFVSQMYEASKKSFWADEKYEITQNSRHQTYLDIIIHGAKLQASPSPLDYLACKFLSDIKQGINSFGLKDEIYFRLFSNFVTTASVLFVVFFLLQNIANVTPRSPVFVFQLFLLLCIPFAYFFTHHVYYYAAETRPYAVWNSLWFITLAISTLNRKDNKILGVMLILLSLTTTATLFQLTAFLLSWIVMELIHKRTLKESVISAAKILAIPFVFALYYCFLRSGKQWNLISAGGDWDNFIKLWTHKATLIPMMLVACAACFFNVQNRRFIVAPLAALIIFLMGPIIFWITQSRGYFFTDRQYIYYELTVVIFVITILQCLPAYWEDMKSVKAKTALVVLFCFLGCILTFRPKIVKRFEKARVQALMVLEKQVQIWR